MVKCGLGRYLRGSVLAYHVEGPELDPQYCKKLIMGSFAAGICVVSWWVVLQLLSGKRQRPVVGCHAFDVQKRNMGINIGHYLCRSSLDHPK
jgi:hypothetical protein